MASRGGRAGSKCPSALDVVSRKVFGTKWRILFTGRFCRCTLPPAFTAAGWLAMGAVLKGVFGTISRPQERVGRFRSVVQKGICCCPSPVVCCCDLGTAQAGPDRRCRSQYRRWMSAQRRSGDAGFPATCTVEIAANSCAGTGSPWMWLPNAQLQEGI